MVRKTLSALLLIYEGWDFWAIFGDYPYLLKRYPLTATLTGMMDPRCGNHGSGI